VHSAELVLFIGCDTGDQVTLNWTVPAYDTKIVQIEADPLEIGRSYPNTTASSATRKQHSPAQPDCRPSVRDSGFADEAAAIVADWRASMTQLSEKNTAPIAVERLCAEVTRALRPTAFWSPTRLFRIWTGTMIDLNGAGQNYQRAAGSLGWAFPPRSAPNAPPGSARSCASPATAASITTSPNWNRPAAPASPSPSSSTTTPLWPEPDRGPSHRRQSAGPGRGADPLWADDFTASRGVSGCAASASNSPARSPGIA